MHRSTLIAAKNRWLAKRLAGEFHLKRYQWKWISHPLELVKHENALEIWIIGDLSNRFHQILTDWRRRYNVRATYHG